MLSLGHSRDDAMQMSASAPSRAQQREALGDWRGGTNWRVKMMSIAAAGGGTSAWLPQSQRKTNPAETVVASLYRIEQHRSQCSRAGNLLNLEPT